MCGVEIKSKHKLNTKVSPGTEQQQAELNPSI